jgi:hypothetical protein
MYQRYTTLSDGTRIAPDRLGVTVTTVARWEREERPIAELVARFVTLLADVAGRPAKQRRR